MITASERQRLMQQYRYDAAASHATVLTCSAGIGVVGLIAVIGIQSGHDTPGAEAGPATQTARVSASVADARSTMDARRERFEGAMPSGVHAAPLPAREARRLALEADVAWLRRWSD